MQTYTSKYTYSFVANLFIKVLKLSSVEYVYYEIIYSNLIVFSEKLDLDLQHKMWYLFHSFVNYFPWNFTDTRLSSLTLELFLLHQFYYKLKFELNRFVPVHYSFLRICISNVSFFPTATYENNLFRYAAIFKCVFLFFTSNVFSIYVIYELLHRM